VQFSEEKAKDNISNIGVPYSTQGASW